MAKKPKDEKPKRDDPKRDEPRTPRGMRRDYSQRAHDVVREVEKRHEDRQKDDETD